MLSDWDLIVAVLAVRGNANRILPEAAQRRVRASADGFGKMSIVQLQELGALYDWSHVRDSSDEGKRQVARAIRAALLEMDRLKNAEFPGLFPDGKHEAAVEEIVGKMGAVPA